MLATLLLRAGMPEGYMPSPAGSGFLFELCPTGVPAAVMQALVGPDSHHHPGASEAAAAHFDAAQCPIGHLLSGAVTIDMQWFNPEAPALAGLAASPQSQNSPTRLFTRHARGPPPT